MNKNIFITSHTIPICFIIAFLTACVNSNQHNDPNKMLEFIAGSDCPSGFIRPPGVKNCLKLDNIVKSADEQGPIGLCPQGWRKYHLQGYCLPAYTMISCGSKTFSCNKEPGDIIKTSKEPVDCEEGTMIVTTGVPEFNQTGAATLVTRIGLSCGVITKADPI